MSSSASPVFFDDETEQRDVRRWALRLNARVSTDGLSQDTARVLNLSQSGILIGWPGRAEVGDTFEVELSHGDTRRARVVWNDDSLFGCRFDEPLPQASLSAALLRSLPAERKAQVISRIEEPGEDAVATVGAPDNAPRLAVPGDALQPSKRAYATALACLGFAAWAVPAAVTWLIG